MRENITKVSQRGERLDALQDKTDNLAQSAQGFRRGANRVRKQMWWKDMKMRMCLIAGVIILIVIIVVPAGTLVSPPAGVLTATQYATTWIPVEPAVHLLTMGSPHFQGQGLIRPIPS